MSKILPKLLLVFALPFFLLSCQAKPEEQGIVLNYRIVHFDTQQDQMQVELSITNHSDLCESNLIVKFFSFFPIDIVQVVPITHRWIQREP